VSTIQEGFSQNKSTPSRFLIAKLRYDQSLSRASHKKYQCFHHQNRPIQAELTLALNLYLYTKYNDYTAPNGGAPQHWWVAGRNSYLGSKIPNRLDCHGIKYVECFLNDQRIDYQYTVVNDPQNGMNIKFIFNSDGTFSPVQRPVPFFYDERIPTEVTHRRKYVDTNVPNDIQRFPLAWVQVITDNSQTENAWVEVDYLRLYGRRRDSGTLELIQGNEYNLT